MIVIDIYHSDLHTIIELYVNGDNISMNMLSVDDVMMYNNINLIHIIEWYKLYHINLKYKNKKLENEVLCPDLFIKV